MCPRQTKLTSNFYHTLWRSNNVMFTKTVILPRFGDSRLSLSRLLFFPISLQVIVLSRRINPHPAKNYLCKSGDLTDRCNYRDEDSDGSRTSSSPTTGDNVGERCSSRPHTVVLKVYIMTFLLTHQR